MLMLYQISYAYLQFSHGIHIRRRVDIHKNAPSIYLKQISVLCIIDIRLDERLRLEFFRFPFKSSTDDEFVQLRLTIFSSLSSNSPWLSPLYHFGLDASVEDV